MVDTFAAFQQFVWDRLPMRRHLCGRERVNDIVSVVVQEWPEVVMENCQSGDTAEIVATSELVKSTKRHLALMYGDREFGFLWVFILNIVAGQVIAIIIAWWRRNHRNHAKLTSWRKEWIHGQ